MRAELIGALALAFASVGAAAQVPTPAIVYPEGPHQLELQLSGGRLLQELDGPGLNLFQVINLLPVLAQYKGFGRPEDAERLAKVIIAYRRARAVEAPGDAQKQADLEDAELTLLSVQYELGRFEAFGDRLAARVAAGPLPGQEDFHAAQIVQFSGVMLSAGSFATARDLAARALVLARPKLGPRGYVPDETSAQLAAASACETLLNESNTEIAKAAAAEQMSQAEIAAMEARANRLTACVTTQFEVIRRDNMRTMHHDALYNLAMAEAALGRHEPARRALRTLIAAPSGYAVAGGQPQLILATLMRADGEPGWREMAETARRLAKADLGIRDPLASFAGQRLPHEQLIGPRDGSGLSAIVLLRAGETELLLDRPQVALTYIEAATPSLDGPLADSALAPVRGRYLLGLARLQAGDPAGALPHLARASAAYDDFTPSTRDARRVAQSRFEGETDIHLAYLEAALAAGDPTAVDLALLRAARSRLSRSVSAVFQRTGGPASAAVRTAQLKGRDAAEADQRLQQLLGSGAASREVAAAVAQAAQRHRDAEAALAAATAVAPGLRLFGLGPPATRTAIQARLGPRDGVLIYAVGRDRGYAALMRQSGPPVVVPLALGRARLAAAVGRVRRSTEFRITPGGVTTPPFEAAASRELHAALVSPLEAELDGLDRLYVSVSAPLDGAPLAALGDGRTWLGERAALSVVLDPSLLARPAPQHPAPTRSVLAIGDPKISGARFLRDLSVGAARTATVESLPGATAELDALLTAYGRRGARLLLRDQATEGALRREPLRDYRLLAFATHAVTHSPAYRDPRPALVLTPRPGAGVADDGLLHAYEIEELELVADLVILSACETAAGDGAPNAEALSGLAQAFLFAGARSVLATQWRVESASASRLMAGAAAGAAAEPDVAVRLQRAMRELRRAPGTAHPAYWAPYVVVEGYISR